jgi:hypothetical protein
MDNRSELPNHTELEQKANIVELILRQQEIVGKPRGADDSAWQEPKD